MDKSLKNTIKKYFLLNHKPQTFIPGVTPVKVSGRVFREHREFRRPKRHSCYFWKWGARPKNKVFQGFAKVCKVPRVQLLNPSKLKKMDSLWICGQKNKYKYWCGGCLGRFCKNGFVEAIKWNK